MVRRHAERSGRDKGGSFGCLSPRGLCPVKVRARSASARNRDAQAMARVPQPWLPPCAANESGAPLTWGFSVRGGLTCENMSS